MLSSGTRVAVSSSLEPVFGNCDPFAYERALDVRAVGASEDDGSPDVRCVSSGDGVPSQLRRRRNVGNWRMLFQREDATEEAAAPGRYTDTAVARS